MNDNDENPEQSQGQQDLRSVFSSNLPDVLKQLGISLAVSTYQAGKLILVRREGDKINTRFSCLCNFDFENSFVPPLAARFYLGSGRGRPLSFKRPGNGGRHSGVCHRPGGNRYGRWLAPKQAGRRAFDGRSPKQDPVSGPFHAPLPPLVP